MDRSASSRCLVDDSRAENGAATLIGRSPFFVAALWAIAGIAVDRLGGANFPIFLAFSVLGAGLWFVTFVGRWHRVSACALGAILFGSFGGWHHMWQNWYATDELGPGVGSDPQSMELRVQLTAAPRITWPSEDPMAPHRNVPVSRAAVRIRTVKDQGVWRVAKGLGMLTVDGELVGLRPGDVLEGVLRASQSRPPMNPGTLPYDRFSRDRRCLLRLQTDYPQALKLVERSSPWNPKWWMPKFRAASEQRLRRTVSADVANITVALLLGAQECIDRDAMDAFLVTGTIHLLSISGLHVMILATSLAWCLLAAGVRRTDQVLVVIAAVILFAWVAGGRAPVVRAAVLTIVWGVAVLLHRPRISLNSLGLSALCVLGINPTQLFNVGAQLSFLSLLTLLAIANSSTSRATDEDPLTQLIAAGESMAWRAWRAIQRGLGNMLWVSTLLWLVTLPLVMHAFHVASLIAVLMNCIVWIPVWFGMLSGFATLCLCWLCPPLAPLVAWPHQLCLNGILWINEKGAAFSIGHLWLTGPGISALLWFYGILGFCFLRDTAVGIRRLGVIAAFVGLLALWYIPWIEINPASARNCVLSFMSLGHGTCVVVELPSGETLLYDAGCLGDSRNAAETISRFLWTRGARKIDCLILSHSDVDHCNAVPLLLQRFPTKRVLVTPQMIHQTSPATNYLVERISARGVPIEESVAANIVWSTPSARIVVLHPTVDTVYPSDNAASQVVFLDSYGRTVLLTGDLEGPGLDALMQRSLHADVALAPHHGSPNSLPGAFLDWCSPCELIISGGDRDSAIRRQFERRTTRVWHTAEDGAVRVILTPQGNLKVDGWMARGTKTEKFATVAGVR